MSLHREDRAVRGWFYEERSDGTARFHAHSVIERGNELIDITCPKAGLPFISHVHENGEFISIAMRKPPTVEHVFDKATRADFLKTLL